ncbi:MTA3 protein, partial [Polyodon spathula]|nr:MTA3 protein [Polyodon spathula]
FHAMDTLHRLDYDLKTVISILVPQGGPVLCRDEMEEWSASEANPFEEALEKYGKDFNDIRQDFKCLKASEAEIKLKQVYIPTYNKPNPHQISMSNGKPLAMNGAAGAGGALSLNSGPGRACESYFSLQSPQWYSWGPPSLQCRLCLSCWVYWKKYGGLKMPSQGEEEEEKRSQRPDQHPRYTILWHGQHQSTFSIPIRNSGSPRSSTKTRQTFLLQATRITKLARHMCRDLLRLRQAARQPFVPINCAAIKAECKSFLNS